MQPPPEQNAPGHAALRRGRISLTGQIYLVTFATRDRIPLFADAAHATTMAPAIIATSLWQHSQLLAWVLMPDHWHGLIQLGGNETLSPVIQRLKTNTAKRLPTAITRPIWAAGFHDHALRKDEDLLATARYLVRNPVRAGIAKTPREYPYWNAAWL